MIHILCGWSNEQACAAAVVLRVHPDAELEPISRKQLTSLLKGMPRRQTPPSEIFIVGLEDRRLEEELHAKTGINITVISNNLEKRRSTDRFTVHQPKRPDSLSLVRRTALALDIPECDIKHLIKIGESKAWVDLLEAGAWYHRIQSSDDFYIQAIRTLAFDEKLTAEQEEGVEFFLQHGPYELRGQSAAISEVRSIANKVGSHPDCPIMITGESGTGKEFVAYSAHFASPRRNGEFHPINCASIPANLMASELYGHVKGAFTGAVENRKGAFRTAHKGTLFLDEIGDMPLELQASLLRVLETKKIMPLGSNKEIKVDIRIICATHRDLLQMVEDGEFREDLYYRLRGVVIQVPPLRDRLEDIADIANSRLFRQEKRGLSQHQLRQLQQYHWPGNVRQLLNVLMKAQAFGTRDYEKMLRDEPGYGAECPATNSRPDGLPSHWSPDDVMISLEEATRRHYLRVYEACDRNIAEAAKVLKVHRNTAARNLKKWV